MTKNKSNSTKNVLTLADLTPVDVQAPVIDMNIVLGNLHDKFSDEFHAIDLANEQVDIAIAFEEQAKAVNVALNTLRSTLKDLKRGFDTAEYAVDKAFSENEKLRKRSIWMRANNRAIEWDQEMTIQKTLAIKSLMGLDYDLYLSTKAKIDEGMAYLVDLDKKARAAYVEADRIKREAGFSTK